MNFNKHDMLFNKFLYIEILDYPNCSDDKNNCARKAMLRNKCASSTAHKCERSCGCGEGTFSFFYIF